MRKIGEKTEGPFPSGGGAPRGRMAPLLALVLACLAAASCALARPGGSTVAAGRAEYAPAGGPLLLLGTWERYRGLPTDAALASSPREAELAEVSLRATLVPGSRAPEGPLTYRVRIALAPPAGGAFPERRMALFLPWLAGFSAVYVDGRPLYDRRSDPTPPPLVIFDTAEDGISVVLQSAEGGARLEESSLVPTFVLFGEAGEVNAFQILAIGLAIFQTGYFFLVGLLMFLLFLNWRKNGEFLAFALYMFSACLFYLFKNGALLQATFPGLGRQALETGYSLAMDLQYLGLVYFLFTLYRARLKSASGRAAAMASLAVPPLLAAAAGAAAFLGSAAAGALVYQASIAWYSLFAVASMVFLAIHAARGEPRARWLLPAFAVVGIAIVLKQVLGGSFASAFLIEPAGTIVFSFIVVLMLVRKVGNMFEAEESLSDYITEVTDTVRSFIPREFLEALEKADVTDLKLGDHVRKEMTIFFSDIRAFTELSERLTPEENFAFINSYLSRVVPIIQETGGFVDKYIGDAIMALFSGPSGPDNAIRAAVAMQAKVTEYNGHRAKMGYRPISMGVGIHTGELMLGVVGVKDRMENTVISDAVNLSSRLQAIAKQFAIGVVISEQAFKDLADPGAHTYRALGVVKVKGKAAPISAYEIMDGIEPELFERKVRTSTDFEMGIVAYRKKDFGEAMYYFKRVLAVVPEDLASGFYIDRCIQREVAQAKR